jgi:hypothetical protein
VALKMPLNKVLYGTAAAVTAAVTAAATAAATAAMVTEFLI